MTQITKEAIEAYKAAYRDHCDKAMLGFIPAQADEITVGATRAGLEAALPFLSSPGKDGGQEVEAVVGAENVFRDGFEAGRCYANLMGPKADTAWQKYSATVDAQPASTALVEALTEAVSFIENLIEDGSDTEAHDREFVARLVSALSSSSTSRKGER